MARTPLYRIEVRPQPGAADPHGAAALRKAQLAGLERPPGRIDLSRVYLIQGDLDPQQVRRVAEELLADPVSEQVFIGAAPPAGDALIEVHPLPGVMDPDAEAVERAVRAMLGIDVAVRTGRRYDFYGTDPATARAVAEQCLANPVIHAIHDQPYEPQALAAGSEYTLRVITVPVRERSPDDLARLSRDAHLFLSPEEMQAIASEYRRLGRDPTEIELETLAQTWSEHCVHKTFKARIRYREEPSDGGSAAPAWAEGRPGHQPNPDGSITIDNLFRSTIVAATDELCADGLDWCLSVFVDNAGVIAFDDQHAVCFKVETHNHPSAIEPYGGAATGIGGCIRDIIGTGLSARPIAATDVFCVAHPDHFTPPGAAGDGSTGLPAGCLGPRRILNDVVAGVRDYGNRMGIPTLNGAVWFDDAYVGNPLVFCGCIGVLPRDLTNGRPRPGDRIVALGGRTGRDGIHGATFSSAGLTDGHADEFSHAVQIGNAMTEKKMLDAVLAARDHPGGCLFAAITDCGAGGFSSAVGEMGEPLGAEVDLERAPLKYEGLSPTEIWISEAQERMVLAVPPENLEPLRAICDLHEVEMCAIGRFGTEGRQLILRYEGTEVGRLSMEFLHEGLPQPTREARWAPKKTGPSPSSPGPVGGDSPRDALLALLSHPNIASKHWIIRQYDHEVQGGSVIKPLVGRLGEGPSDAAVILPDAGSTQGLAIGNGLATGWRDDPYLMALAAIDECVRNLVCVGADPRKIALLDNFCWPGCDDPDQLGALVRAARGCYEGAKAYRTPFISGKDSLNNQFTTEEGRVIRIPPTLLISGMGIVPDVARCTTMDAKEAGNLLLYVGPATCGRLGGSHYAELFGPTDGARDLPVLDLTLGPAAARAVHHVIERGLAASVHDCSDGGLLVAAAEMAMAGDLGLELRLEAVPSAPDAGEALARRLFSEEPARYLLEVRPKDLETIRATLPPGLTLGVIGEFNPTGRLTIPGTGLDETITTLKQAWRAPLDW